MYQLKDADALYLNQRVREALEKIDWDAMNKHLHDERARIQYKETKRFVFFFINSTFNDLAEDVKHPDLAYYDKLFYAARKKSTPDRSFTDKLPILQWIQAKGGIPKKTRVLKGVAAVTGFSFGLGLGLGGLVNAVMKKDSVKTD